MGRFLTLFFVLPIRTMRSTTCSRISSVACLTQREAWPRRTSIPSWSELHVFFSRRPVLFAAFTHRGFVHTEQDSAARDTLRLVSEAFKEKRSPSLLFWECCWNAVLCVFRQLFSYITKERQTESLVEKLCQRFRTAKWVHLHLLYLSSSHLWPASFVLFWGFFTTLFWVRPAVFHLYKMQGWMCG